MQNIMGRYYHLSKKATDEQLKEVLREMREQDNVKKVEITEDHLYMIVETKDDKFEEVMAKAVNICSRVAGGMELSFDKFTAEVQAS